MAAVAVAVAGPGLLQGVYFDLGDGSWRTTCVQYAGGQQLVERHVFWAVFWGRMHSVPSVHGFASFVQQNDMGLKLACFVSTPFGSTGPGSKA